MNTGEDKYIQALKYAQDKNEFTLEELVAALGLSELEEIQFANQIHTKQIFFNNASNYIGYYKQQPIKLYFSVDDKFRLLDHEALQEARQNSVNSTRWATVALVVSIVSLIVSALLSYQQLTSDINIPKGFANNIEAMQKQQLSNSNTLQEIDKRLSNIEAIALRSTEKKISRIDTSKKPDSVIRKR